MKFFKKKIESDFEFFVKALPALEPVEFLGLAKILSVPTVRESELLNFSKEDFEKLKDDESKQAIIAETVIPADEILESVMDKYPTLESEKK